MAQTIRQSVLQGEFIEFLEKPLRGLGQAGGLGNEKGQKQISEGKDHCWVN